GGRVRRPQGPPPPGRRRPARHILEKAHANLVAIEPDALAAPMRAAALGQHEEELPHIDVVDPAVNLQLGARVGDVADLALAVPGSVDRHDLPRVPPPHLTPPRI